MCTVQGKRASASEIKHLRFAPSILAYTLPHIQLPTTMSQTSANGMELIQRKRMNIEEAFLAESHRGISVEEALGDLFPGCFELP